MKLHDISNSLLGYDMNPNSDATCMPTRRLLMMHWHHCKVKQVTMLWEAWMMTSLLS